MVKVIGHPPFRWPTVRRTFLNNLHDARAEAAVRAKSQLCGVRIEGAQGPFAGLINGHYELEGEMHGRVCFRKVLDRDRWLGCNYDGRWIVCDDGEKQDFRHLSGWCQGFSDDESNATAARSPLSMTSWGSWVDKKFVWQPGIRLRGFESGQWSAEKERVQWAEAEAKVQRMALAAESAYGVRVSGASGMSSSCMNGRSIVASLEKRRHFADVCCLVCALCEVAVLAHHSRPMPHRALQAVRRVALRASVVPKRSQRVARLVALVVRIACVFLCLTT